MEDAKKRHVGIDLGKRTYEAAFIDSKGKVRHSNGKTSPEGRQSLCKKLKPTDRVALEAGNLAFQLAKEIGEQVGCEVVVLNPGKLALIYGSMKKTDKEDSLKLAKLAQKFENDELPVVPLPSEKELQRRELIASYRRVKRDRTQKVNQLHGLFLHQGITTVTRKDLAVKKNRDVAAKQLSGFKELESSYIIGQLDMMDAWIDDLKKKIAAECEGDEDIEKLQTIPGVGPVVSLAFSAYIGDINRFDNAAQVTNYLGLVPKVDMSCTIVRYGSITKRGNSYLRGLLVQAAWSIVRSKKGGALRERYEYSKGNNVCKRKTIVGIARRLAALMYTILKNDSKYEERKFRPGVGSVKILKNVALQDAVA
jgi:transposase